MTFVINKAMKQKADFENEDYLFDVEQYNYLINRRSALANQDLIDNSAKLQYVLKKFNEIDVILLDQLQYSFKSDQVKEEYHGEDHDNDTGLSKSGLIRQRMPKVNWSNLMSKMVERVNHPIISQVMIKD